jgi:hypothetical protein
MVVNLPPVPQEPLSHVFSLERDFKIFLQRLITLVLLGSDLLGDSNIVGDPRWAGSWGIG